MQLPQPGTWYANPMGQLLQVRIVLHAAMQPQRVVLEFINGRRESLNMTEWSQLALTVYSQGSDMLTEKPDQNQLV